MDSQKARGFTTHTLSEACNYGWQILLNDTLMKMSLWRFLLRVYSIKDNCYGSKDINLV